MQKSWLAPLLKVRRSLARGQLSNGVQWLALPQSHSPLVSIQIWIRRGSAHDPEGLPGVAHFLEHMMFRGSRAYADGEFDRLSEMNGIEANAMTWLDFTAYLNSAPTEAMRLILELEADRLDAPRLRHDAVEQEREIILNERATHIDSDPDAKLDEFLMRGLSEESSYRRPVIGTPESIQAIGRADLESFQQSVRNARDVFIVATGGFATGEFEAHLEETFGRLALDRAEPPAEVQTRDWQELKIKSGARYVDPELCEPRVIAALPSPAYRSRDAGIALLVGELLNGGAHSVLEQSLEESHPRCVETDFAIDFHQEASFATILAIPESVEDAQDIGLSLLSRVRHAFDNLTADTVDLARERLVMRALSGLDDVGDLAEEIATDELYAPGESTPFRTLEAATNASLTEVHDFVQRWLRPKNASVVVATGG